MTVDALISTFASRLDLDISVARTPETGEPLMESDEEIKLSTDSVALILGSSSEAGTGTLYITTRCEGNRAISHANYSGIWIMIDEYRCQVLYPCPNTHERRVIWTTSTGSSIGLRYPQIVMHAISRDASAFPRPCIYLQVRNGQ